MKKSNLIFLLIALAVLAGGMVIKTTSATNSSDQTPGNVGLNIGQVAPDLEFKDPNGTPIKLSSLRGYVVLIDFWASWCRPCRIENPNVVKAYRTFKDKKFNEGKKGFAIYNVSLDNNMEAWKAAIVKDSLEWKHHVSDLKGWSSAAAMTYQVNSIPTNYLIDGNGVIIAKNLRGNVLHEQLNKIVKK